MRFIARVAVGSLFAALTGCASASPGPNGKENGLKNRDEGARVSKLAAVAAEEAARAEAAKKRAETEREAKLDEACGDVDRFAKVARATASGKEKQALEAWNGSRDNKGASSPAALEHRRTAEDLARLYMARCGVKEAIDLTIKLVAFPTVSARESAKKGASFLAMIDFLRDWTAKAGLELRVFGENDAWEIGYGSGAAKIAFVMHADVVPEGEGVDAANPPPGSGAGSGAASGAGSGATGTKEAAAANELPPGWTRPPFRAEVAGDRLYGRGTEDDKGPIAVVLVMMKTLAKLGQPTGRILAILGTGEEHDWSGMKRYADATPKPPFVISVDANFPVVVAESGFVAWHLAAPMKGGAAGGKAKKKSNVRCAIARDAKGGQFLTQVPGEATLAMAPPKGESADSFVKRIQAASSEVAKSHGGNFRFEVLPGADSQVALRVLGTAVHSSVADEGHNALWGLAAAANRLELCESGIATIMHLIGARFDGDHWGEHLGLAYQDELMGRLLVTPTLLRVEGDRVKLSINMRRPRGISSEDFGHKLDRALDDLKRTVDGSLHEVGERYVGEPAIADTSGPLVATLIDLFKEQQNDPGAKGIAIRGGTYARLFPGAVSFGPALPGHPYRGHAPDEYIEIDAIRVLTRVLLEATFRLDAIGADARAVR